VASVDFVPARSVVAEEAGRRVSYSFATPRHRGVAPGRGRHRAATLLFTGESMIAGFGLAWEETIPVRVGALLGTQSANLAVSDYSNDQSYLRLAAELPRYREPVAVVTLFMPSLFDRISSTIARTWQRDWSAAGRPALALAALLRWLIPYRSSAAVEQGITRTRDSLRALVDLARARALSRYRCPAIRPESATEEICGGASSMSRSAVRARETRSRAGICQAIAPRSTRVPSDCNRGRSAAAWTDGCSRRNDHQSGDYRPMTVRAAAARMSVLKAAQSISPHGDR